MKTNAIIAFISAVSKCGLVICLLSISLGLYGVPRVNAAELERSLIQNALSKSKMEATISRQKATEKGFLDFKAKVYREPFDGGMYIVNGDTPIPSDKELLDFYRKELLHEWPTIDFGTKLIADAPGGKVTGWDNASKRALKYCVSTSFGSHYKVVVEAMIAATTAWEQVSDVHFVHIDTLDNECGPTTDNVVFDIRPINVSGEYYARAFFPRYQRNQRNILIDVSAFNLNPSQTLTLVGILRHELGHVLGFRHEHTRAESGKCFEDKNWVPLTNYDAFSVMHYPHCNGLGDWSLNLTENDKIGAACLYGAPRGVMFDPQKLCNSY